MKRHDRLVLELVSVALGNKKTLVIPANTNWQKVAAIASYHCVESLVLEAIQLQSGNQDFWIDDDSLLDFIGLASTQEKEYTHSWEVANELASLWHEKGIRATIIKGRSIAQYYPHPNHRYSCDLDLFIDDGWESASDILEKRGIKLSREVYKEVEFNMNGVYVECHKFITPVRGNKTLQDVERYLRSRLHDDQHCFDDSYLINPLLDFTVMLYMEHALGDFLHGKLFLKHIVDWIVLRRQPVDWEEFNTRCREFRFERFEKLISSLADVVEGKKDYKSLPTSYQQAFDEAIKIKIEGSGKKSWFKRRMELFWSIVKNSKRYRDFGYCSMPRFLFMAVWSHFFDKEVKLSVKKS